MPHDPGRTNDFRRQLLRSLQENCDRLNRDIAAELKTDASRVSRTRSGLIKSGCVQGFKAVLNPEVLGINTLAFIYIKLNDKSKMDQTIEFVLRWPEVQELHLIDGQFDLLLKLRTKTNKELFSFIRDMLANKHNIEETNTTIVMETKRETSDISL